MFEDKYMDFGEYNVESASSSSGHCLLPDTKPFLKNQSHNNSNNGPDMCKKLSKMGITCGMSIWSKPELFRVYPVDYGSRTTLHETFSGFQRNLGEASRHDFLQNTSHGVFHGDNRLLDFQDSQGFIEMVALKHAFFFEGKNNSRAPAAMEVSGVSYLDYMVSIYGSVILMAKDQIGSKFLQKLVDEGTYLENPFFRHFLEIIVHVVELSTDPYGNYLVQELLNVCDEKLRTLIVTVLTSNPMELISICFNNYGTRVVQKVIETVKTRQQIGMVMSGLNPVFVALVKDLNGNHVIQTCLKSLGPNDNKFLLEEVTKYCFDIAYDRIGCCVLQCCVSNSVGLQRERLIDEISRNSLHLSQDPYGNYVVQYLIENKVSSEKLLKQFRMHYVELATQKFSSHVVEKCLTHYPESRADIVRELLSVPNFEYLLHDRFGNYVIQTALDKTNGFVRERLVEKVRRFGKLKSSSYCKKVFSKINLKR